MTKTDTTLAILGAGPAGYTAGIYAARANREPLVLTGPTPGGQMTITTDVENYPGFEATIQGPDLMEQMRTQALRVGARLEAGCVTKVENLEQNGDKDGDGQVSEKPPDETPIYQIHCEEGRTYTARAVIIATGAKARWLGLADEELWRGRGLSACATCDGFFFKAQPVLVVGGGNSAVEEALYLAGLASRVTLVHRRDQLRADKILQTRLFQHPKIRVAWNKRVQSYIGNATQGLTGVRLSDTRAGAPETTELLEAAGVFIAIGHDPASEPFRDLVPCRPDGTIQTLAGTTQTTRPGLFAAGDVADPTYRQAVTAAAMGCMAALDAERYLQAQGL